MSVVKTKLKAARDAIAKKDFASARDNAEKVLDYEPDNYNANVFLGLALLELGDHVKSEQAYLTAIESNPSQLLSWQGLSRFYERVENWDKLADTLGRLLDLAADATKCAETLQKLIQLRRTRGTPAQLVDVLSLLLFDSKCVGLLSSLPPPDPTNPTLTTFFEIQEAMHNIIPIIEEIVSIVEKQEEHHLKKEVEKRRTRLGAAGPEQLRKDVVAEISSQSRLPDLYNDIINHPSTSDELRRSTEHKLLEYKKRYLFALPKSSSLKETLSDELHSMINGAIILQIPDELVWALFFDRKDVETVEAYDLSSLRLFMKLFPDHPLTRMLKGYFIYFSVPLEVDEDEEVEMTPADDPDVGLDMIFDSQPRLPNSLIATRLVADVYLREADYTNAIKIAESGIELARRAEANHGVTLELTHLGFKVILATSLVHLFPPKHHIRALALIDDILNHSPDNVHTLMGRAYIMEESEKWEDAAELFSRVNGLLSADMNDGLRAKEEHAWCRSKLGDLDFAIGAFTEVLEVMNTFKDPGSESARCLWRLGNCYWDLGVDTRDEAYKRWILTLKRDSMYAPAFTSLGKYYEEYVSPPDHVRASKCFQKAFELDSREVYAARRLALGFAEEREWDLVEVVARRTIEGEGGLDAGLEAQSKTSTILFTPMNSWAWKAVGTVELLRRHYVPAIQAFQVALRADPDDHLSWLRLGEAYATAGRHAAALKALTRAHELDPTDWMSLYFIGDVRRQTGQYQEAITLFKEILDKRPDEIGVSVMLATTYLDMGRSEVSGGYMARAEKSFLEALRVSLGAVNASSGFRSVVWKILADAMYHLSTRPTFVDESGVRDILDLVMPSLSASSSDRLTGMSIAPNLASSPLTGSTLLQIAILAYDHRLSVSSAEPQALASAWFDLGMAVRICSTNLGDEEKKAKVGKQGIGFIRCALRECPGVQEYWLALGDAYFIDQPKSAQHAFIRALEIDNKCAEVWVHLGLLYLYHSDVELANEALFRAQTLDPDYTLAWVGQALVAITNGHDRDASALLEHAIGLANSVPFADLELSYRAFSTYKSSKSPSSHLSLLPCLTLMSRYLTLHPTSVPGLHLSSLIHEAIGQLEKAQSLLSTVVSILEAMYEETESAEIERQYVIAQANMGRVKLGAADYEGAIECFETVSGLLLEATDGDAKALRAEAHFASAMAKFRLGTDFEEVSTAFDEASALATDDLTLAGHVSVLQAKTMWAQGSAEWKDGAKNVLLECIEKDPENLAAINALAAMGILTEDESLLDAALSEILSLPREQRAHMDPQKEVDYLLIKHHQGLGEHKKAASLVQHAIIANPSDSEPRVRLASLAMEEGDIKNALSLVAGSSSASIDLESTELVLRAVARASSDKETACREAQRAVMLAPGDQSRWLALAYTYSKPMN